MMMHLIINFGKLLMHFRDKEIKVQNLKSVFFSLAGWKLLDCFSGEEEYCCFTYDT